jgi:hypothetical protein
MRCHAGFIPSGHITGGRACLEIAGAAKRPERGKSHDTRRPPGSFHDGGEVEKTGIANDDAISRSICGTSNAAQVQEALQKLLPKRVGPFILQPLRGGKNESGKWKQASSTHSRQRAAEITPRLKSRRFIPAYLILGAKVPPHRG